MFFDLRSKYGDGESLLWHIRLNALSVCKFQTFSVINSTNWMTKISTFNLLKNCHRTMKVFAPSEENWGCYFS